MKPLDVKILLQRSKITSVAPFTKILKNPGDY